MQRNRGSDVLVRHVIFRAAHTGRISTMQPAKQAAAMATARRRADTRPPRIPDAMQSRTHKSVKLVTRYPVLHEAASNSFLFSFAAW